MTDSRVKDKADIDRRSFVAGAIGAAAGVGALLSQSAQAQPPPGGPPQGRELGTTAGGAIPPEMRRPQSLFRLEADVHDCQVTGKVPTDLNGAFYRVGPDAHDSTLEPGVHDLLRRGRRRERSDPQQETREQARAAGGATGNEGQAGLAAPLHACVPEGRAVRG